jgi:hypothetical protein
MATALQLKPYDKGIHIRFNPSMQQLEEAKATAKAFAASVVASSIK